MTTLAFYINGLSNSGGTERVTTTLANYLSCLGFKVILITNNAGEPFFKLDSNISVICLEKKKGYASFLSTVVSLRKICDIYNVDVVIAIDSLLALYTIPATLFSHIQRIVWEHFSFEKNINRRLRTFSRYFSGWFADDIVVLTNSDKLMWENKIRHLRAQIHTIYNPVSFHNIEFYKGKSNKIVTSIGRLVEAKGFSNLISAWSKVSIKGWTLNIIGDGPEKDILKKKCIDLNLNDSISILDAKKNLSDIYLNTTILVSASKEEGFGMVLAEAMTYGIPVISTKCVGPNELLSNDYGILVNNDIDALSKSLEELISNEDKRDYYSRKSYERSDCFNIDNVGRNWINIFIKKESV